MKFINSKKIVDFKKNLFSKIKLLNGKRKVVFKKTYQFIQKKPFTSFFAVLGVFLILMIIGNVLFSPKSEIQNNNQAPKIVQIYKIGNAPEVSFQGKVEKSGVVKIVAQISGIVNNINVFEGQQIGKGTNILSLSTNYSGANAATVSRQIAGEQYSNAKDTYDTQKAVIAKQRELADKNKDNTDLLRNIIAQSATSTADLVSLDQTLVDSWQAEVDSEPNPLPKRQDQGFLAQYKSAVIQATSSQQQLSVQSNDNSADIASLQHDIAIKQLDIQERALQMTLDVAGLQLRLAQINEANMYPSSPFAGTVNKIFVHIGDNVNPGTLLANITGNDQHAEIVVQVPADIAKNISNFEPSTLIINNKPIQMLPTFVSRDATNGVLYSVIYQLDDSLAFNLTDATYINIKIPVGVADTTNIDPFIPLDSVIQTQDEAFVFIAENGIAHSKKITLGQIQGRYVEALTGLPKNAQVIIDRNVIDGDKVSVSN